MKAVSEPLVVTLRPVEGEAAGWQLLDGRTGAVLEEGPWVTEMMDSPVPLPEEDGDYRILVSTVSPEHGWAYKRGRKMRVVDVVVRGGTASVREDRETTFRALRLERLPERIGRLLVEPWTLVWSNRSLIQAMVRRDLLARYRGSFGDVAWTILNPLLLMMTYWFVFDVVLRTRFGDNRPHVFILYFLSGMLPWLAFSEAVGRAPNIILEHRNFVKKLVFPVQILPVNLVISGLITGVVALVLYMLLHGIILGDLPSQVLWLPFVLAPQLLFTVGVCWTWAALGAFSRDLAQINGFLLTLLFFLTPICYPEQSIPAWSLVLLRKNPIYKLVGNYRLMLLSDMGLDWWVVAQLWLIGIAAFYGGYAIFRKLRPGFVDVL